MAYSETRLIRKEFAMDMTKPKAALTRIKTTVVANKVAFAVGTVALAAVALQQRNRVDFDKFLTSKGIDPEEYYCPESFQEKNA